MVHSLTCKIFRLCNIFAIRNTGWFIWSESRVVWQVDRFGVLCIWPATMRWYLLPKQDGCRVSQISVNATTQMDRPVYEVRSLFSDSDWIDARHNCMEINPYQPDVIFISGPLYLTTHKIPWTTIHEPADSRWPADNPLPNPDSDTRTLWHTSPKDTAQTLSFEAFP